MDIKDAVYVLQLHEEEAKVHHQRLHKHSIDCFELHFFLEGSGKLKIGNITYSIGKGSLFVIDGNIEHKITADKDSAITYYAILMQYDSKDAPIISSLYDKGLFKTDTKQRFLFEEIKDKGISTNKILRLSACYQLLGFLYALDFNYKGSTKIENNESTNMALAKATNYMERHIFDSIFLDDIASYVRLDSSYLVRLFSSSFHTPPMKFYFNLKIDAAKTLLATSTLSIKEIAAKLSFCNEFYFSKRFKEVVGEAPTKYRKTHLQLLGGKNIDV
ncbi:MAG: helix-turn-helix domain-containing protein [Spirochaetaceae bacterium]|nr:helix-turn-helix domain-containing protein [Spirochaetaceae bacterium]